MMAINDLERGLINEANEVDEVPGQAPDSPVGVNSGVESDFVASTIASKEPSFEVAIDSPESGSEKEPVPTEVFCKSAGRIACGDCPLVKLCNPAEIENFTAFDDRIIDNSSMESDEHEITEEEVQESVAVKNEEPKKLMEERKFKKEPKEILKETPKEVPKEVYKKLSKKEPEEALKEAPQKASSIEKNETTKELSKKNPEEEKGAINKSVSEGKNLKSVGSVKREESFVSEKVAVKHKPVHKSLIIDEFIPLEKFKDNTAIEPIMGKETLSVVEGKSSDKERVGAVNEREGDKTKVKRNSNEATLKPETKKTVEILKRPSYRELLLDDSISMVTTKGFVRTPDYAEPIASEIVLKNHEKPNTKNIFIKEELRANEQIKINKSSTQFSQTPKPIIALDTHTELSPDMNAIPTMSLDDSEAPLIATTIDNVSAPNDVLDVDDTIPYVMEVDITKAKIDSGNDLVTIEEPSLVDSSILTEGQSMGEGTIKIKEPYVEEFNITTKPAVKVQSEVPNISGDDIATIDFGQEGLLVGAINDDVLEEISAAELIYEKKDVKEEDNNYTLQVPKEFATEKEIDYEEIIYLKPDVKQLKLNDSFSISNSDEEDLMHRLLGAFSYYAVMNLI